MSDLDLPEVGEPLVLADGTRINPLDGSVISPVSTAMTEVPTDREAVAMIVKVRRRIGDLPMPPNQMNIVSLILSYSLMGLTDDDIATCIGIPVNRVSAIKLVEAYSDLQATLVKQLMLVDHDNVRTLISQSAISAAKKVTHIMENAKSDDLQLAAAKDILDRDGHRPADIVEHRHTIEGGLQIEYVDRKATNVLDGINVDITDGELT